MDHNVGKNSQNHEITMKPSKCLKNLTFSRQGEKVTLATVSEFFCNVLANSQAGAIPGQDLGQAARR